MRQRQLGVLPVSGLCLGTMYFGTHVDEATSFAILDRFVEAGGTLLDTANTYAFWVEGATGVESELLLGRWLRSRDAYDDVVLATKCGARPTGAGDWPASAEGLSRRVVHEQARASLERLGAERLGVYYAHFEDRGTPLRETTEAFAELVDDGLIAVPGCSNYPAWRIAEARDLAATLGRPGFGCVQQMHTYLRPLGGGWFPAANRYATDELLDYGRAHPEFTLLAYSPLLSGAYTRPDRPVPEFYRHPGYEQRLATLADVAKELGATPNQVVLAWLMASDPAWLPVLGVSSVAQLEEALGAAELVLPDTVLARLTAA